MADMEQFLEHVELLMQDGPIPENHSAVAGRMILFNLIKSDGGSEMMEDVFGLPFIRKDHDLYRNLSQVCNILAYILEHGMPEDILDYYSNCSERIVEDLKVAIQLIDDECKARGMTDLEQIEEIKKSSGVDVDYIDHIFTNWEPLENVHVA